MIFFNDEGTENGGLTFSGQRGPDGRYRASTGMSFDQFDQDQVVVLRRAFRLRQQQGPVVRRERARIDVVALVGDAARRFRPVP